MPDGKNRLHWILPWIALGLASALAIALLRPEWLRPGRAGPEVIAAPQAQAGSALPPPAVAEAAEPVPSTAGLGFADAVERSAPAVVNIYAERRVQVPAIGALPPQLGRLFGDVWPGYRERVERSLGSGIIYDASGHIVTNYHLVGRAAQISVQLHDGREGPARVVGVDPDTDLAVLQVDLKRLPAITLARSDRLRVGEPVLAIGNPLGLGQTVTQGIISATGRGQLGVSIFENFIQTDAAINFGNSGGALVNLQGQLVGINTAVPARDAGIQGIGFAIPVDLVRGVVEAILKDGRVVRGWIGVLPRDVSAAEAEQFGLPAGSVVVWSVFKGSPAAAQGVSRGDVITSVNGTPLRGAQDLLARIASLKPGQGLRLALWRGPPFEGPAREHDLRIEVIERPAQAAASS